MKSLSSIRDTDKAANNYVEVHLDSLVQGHTDVIRQPFILMVRTAYAGKGHATEEDTGCIVANLATMEGDVLLDHDGDPVTFMIAGPVRILVDDRDKTPASDTPSKPTLVEMHRSWAWTCESCGRDNYTREARIHLGPDDVKQRLVNSGHISEYQDTPEGARVSDIRLPVIVACDYCGHEYQADYHQLK
jgi:hypothetical protein